MPDEPIQIPGYRLLTELGRGASGVVYLAREEALGRDVALKLLKAPVAHMPEVRARFEREVRSAARVRHPGIVPVLTTGEASGRLWYTMEVVEGASLDRVLSVAPEGRLPLGRAARIVMETARVLAAAHTAGVTHRDVKPANIALVTEPAPPLEASAGTRRMLSSWTREPGPAGEVRVDRPRLMDFGLASDSASARLSESGMLIGTPGYMAPEQFRGRPGEVGPASDQWALGVVLYEALTGRLPFPGDDLPTLARLVTEEEPIPPSKLDPHIDSELETICLTCLAKAPRERYPSCSALAADLDRWLREEPIAARPPGVWRRTRGWARKRPRLTTALLAALLAGLGALGFSLVVSGQEDARVRRLAADARDAEARGAYAEAEERYGDWSAADPLSEAPRLGRERMRAVQQALEAQAQARALLARMQAVRAGEAEVAELARRARDGGLFEGARVLGLGDARGSEPWWMREPAYRARLQAERRAGELVQAHAEVEAALAVVLSAAQAAAPRAGPEGARVLDQVRREAARWHLEEWRQAEARGDAAQAARHRLAVEQLDPAPHRAELEGHGLLTLVPPSLPGQAWLFRYVREADVLPRGRPRLVPMPVAPQAAGALAGSVPEPYVALLRARLADQGSRPVMPDVPAPASATPDDALHVGTAEGVLRRERYAALRDGSAYPLVTSSLNRVEGLAGGGALTLSPGRYLLLWESPGRLPVRLPFALARRQEAELRVPEPLGPEELPPGFVAVPAGPVEPGLDAAQAGPFLAERLEVTFAQWWEFLNDPRTRAEIARVQAEAAAEGRTDVPWRFVPRNADGPLAEVEGGGSVAQAPFAALPNPERPLVHVSLYDLAGYPEPPPGEKEPLDGQVVELADALSRSETVGWGYLAWRTARSRAAAQAVRGDGPLPPDVARVPGPGGVPEVRALLFTLPSVAEWLRMASGGDGRLYAFGDEPDWGAFKGQRSRRVNAAPEPVGLFADDESPFGVRDLTGSVGEWTATWRESERTFGVCGASWDERDLAQCRLPVRRTRPPRAAPPDVGVRLIVRRTEPVR